MRQRLYLHIDLLMKQHGAKRDEKIFYGKIIVKKEKYD